MEYLKKEVSGETIHLSWNFSRLGAVFFQIFHKFFRMRKSIDSRKEKIIFDSVATPVRWDFGHFILVNHNAFISSERNIFGILFFLISDEIVWFKVELAVVSSTSPNLPLSLFLLYNYNILCVSVIWVLSCRSTGF